MKINAHTKIGAIIKAHSGALDAIVSISPKFEKLRNPFLRKLMAGRTSIAMAAKIGGCKEDDFFEKLKPLGFEFEYTADVQKQAGSVVVPGFMKTVGSSEIKELDVRPVLAGGKDPLQDILKATSAMKQGEILKIINSFEPAPLILLLGKKGFESYTEIQGETLVHTYFFKASPDAGVPPVTAGHAADWDAVFQKYQGHMQEVDVREMEMPQPMITILAALDQLPPGMALRVYHKRIPVFLLPELAEMKWEYRIKETNPNLVELLLFKP